MKETKSDYIDIITKLKKIFSRMFLFTLGFVFFFYGARVLLQYVRHGNTINFEYGFFIFLIAFGIIIELLIICSLFESLIDYCKKREKLLFKVFWYSLILIASCSLSFTIMYPMILKSDGYINCDLLNHTKTRHTIHYASNATFCQK
ncbi:UNVERIFIED_ORG: magnesium-transporting ATPase (P-type) [Rahnella aquatilis]